MLFLVFYVFSLGFFCFRQAIFETIIVADFQGCYRVTWCLGTAANDDTGFAEAFRFNTPLTSETGDSRSFALARGTFDPTVVRWRKSLISYVDKQQASYDRLILASLDVETLGPLEKFVGIGRDFVDANRDLFLRVGRTSLLAR